MASFAPLHTGQFIIRPRTLRTKRSFWVGSVLLALVLLYAAFELGRGLTGYSVTSSLQQRMTQSMRIDDLQGEVSRLRKELSSVQVGSKVDSQSVDSVQQSLASLNATILKQKEEIAFYKAIVSPDEALPVEPVTQRIEVQPDAADGRYHLRLVLTQPMAAAGNAQGTVKVEVTGKRAGQPVSLPLQDLLVEPGDAAMKFSYRYFQTLEHLIAVPADFQPEALQIEMRSSQHPVRRQTFPWQPRPA
jgi:hypothetical protein